MASEAPPMLQSCHKGQNLAKTVGRLVVTFGRLTACGIARNVLIHPSNYAVWEEPWERGGLLIRIRKRDRLG